MENYKLLCSNLSIQFKLVDNLKIKNSEEKGKAQKSDINSQIEIIGEHLKNIFSVIEINEQRWKSVDSRLRALEKKFKIEAEHLPSGDKVVIEGTEGKELEKLQKSVELLSKSIGMIKEEGVIDVVSRVDSLQAEVSKLNSKISVSGGKITPEIESTVASVHAQLVKLNEGIREHEAQLFDAQRRVAKLEKLNKVEIGGIKVPIELSGLLAAIVMLGTGVLLAMDQWEIVKSPFYVIMIGILFGVVVIAKFLMVNKE